MLRFKNILFINEPPGNKAAFRRVVELSRRNRATLTVASVSEDFPPYLQSLEQTYFEQLDKPIADELKKSDAEGVDVNFTHLTGVPFIQIIKYVQSSRIDLVAKPVEGRGGMVDRLFGSDDMHLLRKCPCPVWLIKPVRRKTYTRIMAAVDPDPAEAVNAELNELILQLAGSLAAQENSELHIVHSWALVYENLLRGRARMPKKELDYLLRETRLQHKARLDELINGHDFQDLRIKAHLLKGNPGDVIPKQARNRRIDLIVMGTVARTGIPGFFIGNTAERILSQVDCSVLAVKPSGFETPVK